MKIVFRLQKRVDRMEGVIGSIVSKIDMVLIKLESMEKTKSKKKQNLSKMFEGLTGEAGIDNPANNFPESYFLHRKIYCFP